MTSEQTNEKQTFKIKLEKHETGEATGTIENAKKPEFAESRKRLKNC